MSCSLLNRLTLFVVTLLFASAAQGVDVTVDCDKGKSISQTLAKLDPSARTTVHVSGTCNENVKISEFDRLTLLGNPGATINDHSSGTDNVILVDRSRATIEGLTINGGSIGIDCVDSYCWLEGNVIQGATSVSGGEAAGVFFARSTGVVFNNRIQGNEVGLALSRGIVALAGGAIQNNVTGVAVANQSVLSLHGRGLTIQNNAGDGVAAENNSTVVMFPGPMMFPSNTITGNGGAGLALRLASVATVFGSNTITNNSIMGILVGALSAVALRGEGMNISGNGQPDVRCEGPFSYAKGAEKAATTNCVQP